MTATFNKPQSALAAPTPVAIYLAQHAEVPQLYEWVTALPKGVPGPFAKLKAQPTFASELARALLARSEPLIDIAVAGFCDDHETLLTLWGRRDHAIRLAIAANPYRVGFTGLDEGALRELVEQPDDDLIRLVVTNPSMTSPALATLFNREGVFASVDDTSWLRAIRAAANAPVLTSEIPLEVLMDRFGLGDGFNYHKSRAGFYGAWGLVDSLAPTTSAAEALEQLLLKIVDFEPPLEQHGYGLAEATDRTRSIELHKAAQQRFVRDSLLKWRRENAPGGQPPLAQFEPDYHAGVRTAIARAAAKAGVLVDELRASEDKWTRIGAYTEGANWTIENIVQSYERDGIDFLQEAVGNPAFHERGVLRDQFRELFDRFVRNPPEDAPGAQDQLRDLHHTFRLVGEALWKSDWTRYPAPYENIDGGPDTRPDHALTLTERVEKIERGINDSLRRTAVLHVDRIEAGGATREEAETEVAPLWAIRDVAVSLSAAMKHIAGAIEAQQTQLQRPAVVPGAGGGATILSWSVVFVLGFLAARYFFK